MQLNESIITLLHFLSQHEGEETKYLKTNTKQATILSGGEQLVQINNNSILLFDKYNLQDKINTTQQMMGTVNLENIEHFFESISESIIRLNHVGISYACKNFDKEIKQYLKILKPGKTMFKEESENSDNKWFFIGDKTNWQDPLFEIVLNNPENHFLKSWIPHFQIDIDTLLEAEQIENALKQTTGRGFDWKMDIQNIGVPLGMQILGSINGTKICLGLGTRKREFEYHRKNMLKPVILQ